MHSPVRIMGIVNVTPDSFFDGGAYLKPDAAIAHGLQLIEDGADILDIGGESTRPGATPLSPAEESARVIPVIEGLAAIARERKVAISIDTRNAATMEAALKAGASMVNDVSALGHDPRSIAVVAAGNCQVVLMHMQGTPKTMQAEPAYADVVEDVYDYLATRIDVAVKTGIARDRIMIDPGIGFGKTVDHNLALLRSLPRFCALAPVLIGASRKQFIARLSKGEPAQDRLAGSIAAALYAAETGASILRVHDVAATVQAIKIWQALQKDRG